VSTGRSRKASGAEGDTEIAKYMLKFLHQNTGQNYYIKINNVFLEYMTEFKCLGKTVTDQNLIQEKLRLD
jgi:hypothetical protein